nr:MAG TPA: hypothetical protein [Caudoviricetes sp.]DAX69658.1 MAG TPA: hypothetical protein [Caudoviricetes sp.]
MLLSPTWGMHWFFILRVGQIFGSSKMNPQVMLF